MKTLIEIHALQNFAPSNLNRDDTGAPKDAWFGGTRRARISSQCHKRAIRTYFNELVEQGILDADDIGVRTKRLLGEIEEILKEKRHNDPQFLDKIRLELTAAKLTIKDNDKSDVLLFLRKEEIRKIAKILDENWDSIKLQKKTVKKVSATEEVEESETEQDPKKPELNTKLEAKPNPKLEEMLKDALLKRGKALDVALFGRMLASMPEKNQDASCQVAHSISTHTVEREFDFYTAIDDLKPEDTAGADMIGTIEFNSACFYRYAVLDMERLLKNLQGDEALAKKGIRAFLEGFIVSEPTGKQNSFAAHNHAEFIAINIRKNMAACNLANAFEAPARMERDKSLTLSSANRLIEKEKSLDKAFGKPEETYVLNLVGADISNFGIAVSNVDELLSKSLAAIKE